MKALFRTLFGDPATAAAVAVVLAVALLLRDLEVRWLLVPCATLAAAAWLAWRG